MPLLGPNGQPISSAQTYKKATAPPLGPAFGDWAGRDASFNQLPGGAILQFDLEALTLADFRAMRHNPKINGALSLLTFMMHQMDWWIECEDKQIAQACEENLRNTWTRLIRALSQAYWAGFSPIVPEWENDLENKRVVVNKWKDLVPEECTVHWKEVTGHKNRKFKIYDGIDQSFLGGRFRSDGRVVVERITRGGNDEPDIPAQNTLWYPLLMENGDYYGRKLLKAAFAPWYFSILMHLYANRYYERYGEPTPIGRANFDDMVDVGNGEMKTGKEVMELILQTLRNRSVVVLPSDRDPLTKDFDYTLEYLESQMRGADFERYMTRLDEEMSLAIFMPLLLMTTGDVGSHNLGVQHTQTWLWMLNALAGDKKEYIDRYYCERFKAVNFSPKAPRCEWKFRPMGKENAESIRAIINALITNDKATVNLDELGMYLGMTVKEVRVATEDPEAPGGTDDRASRDRPGRNKPRGVGEPRATGREVSNRVSTQVEKAFRNGNLNSIRPDFGFKKRMVQAWLTEGCDPAKADKLTDQVYGKLQNWFEQAASLGASEYSGHREFMALFDRAMDVILEDANAER